MVRSRRGTTGQNEPEATGARLEGEYAAVLGQIDPGRELQRSVVLGEASPGTMEQGGVEALPGLAASPFHSERVRDEVELLRRRPVGLDLEHARVEAEMVNPGSPLEPDYSLAFGASPNSGPRVARVETCEPSAGTGLELSGMGVGVTSSTSPSTSAKAGENLVPAAVNVSPTEGPSRTAGETESEEVFQNTAATGASGCGGQGPSDKDQRELIPDQEITSPMEAMLAQVLEDNRQLRRRLEQAELHSHSSWHSGVQGEPAIGASPVSFTVEGGSHFSAPVQTWSELGRFVGIPARDQGRPALGSFPGPGDDEVSAYRRGETVITSGAQPLMGCTQGLSVVGGSSGLRGAEGLELVPFGKEGFSSLPSQPGMNDGCFPQQNSRTPPPPLPCTAPVTPLGAVPMTAQPMRQFTAQVAGEASGLGVQGGFHTPRSTLGGVGGFDASGYPISPGSTVIRPPPGPPPREAPQYVGPPGYGVGGPGAAGSGPGVREGQLAGQPGPLGCVSGNREVQGFGDGVRPEEPAKYINELPKLNQTELSQSAVVCGNWLAQVRQILVGLSPSATVWWRGVEGPATLAYQRWLVADPLGRLGLDPSSVVGEFDRHLYGRVASRATSLLLEAVPQSVRDDVVTNRWLSSASILFRVLCLFQPGGSSERSHLLSQLVNPEPCRTFNDAIKGLRRWQQGLQRAGEIHATLPDASLLLRGIDHATLSLLTAHQMIGFRVNAFRHQLAIDYNPSVASVVQLVRLIQAECEAASIASDGSVGKKARSAALAAAGASREGPPPKSVPIPPPPPVVTVAAATVEKGEGKGKGAAKGKGGEAGQQLCHKFSDASGCRFGDACIFKHDRVRARKEDRCLACGRTGHFRPECPVVTPENRVVAADGGKEGSPKAGSPKAGKGQRAQAKAKPKGGSQAQAKGIEETGPPVEATVASASAGNSSASPPVNQETLVAEATRLLKGVSLRALRFEDCEGNLAWVRSALANASNPDFCLVDSGATNALRPASKDELGTCRVIHVDLASGGAELMINDCGTLLHPGPCQVILPANYLVQLGFSIVWKKHGCKIKHPKRGLLEVSVVKGCPLIPRDVGLELLRDYENRVSGVALLSKAEVQDLQVGMSPVQARRWLRDRLGSRGVGITDVDQLVFLKSMLPSIPVGVLARVCVPALGESFVDWSELPWNRRFRRSTSRAAPGSVVISVSPGHCVWRGLGKVIAVADSDRGLGSTVVFQVLLRWAEQGKIGGMIQGEGLLDFSEKGEFCQWSWEDSEEDGWKTLIEGSVKILRWFLLFAVAQAKKDLEHACEDINQAISPGVNDENSVVVPSSSPRIQPRAGKSQRDRDLVFLVSGFPGDPRCKGVGDESGIRWDPKSVNALVAAYDLHRAQFDQACFGARERVRAEMVTSSWLLFEAVHEVRMSPTATLDWSLNHSEDASGRRSRKDWASGLLRVIQGAWCRWCALGCQVEEVRDRRAWLARVTTEDQYARHIAHDHVPYLKGCPVCIRAQGRRRSHWRSGFPGVHSASFDIAGPFVPGQAFNPEVSGRDKGKGYRYFLACAYAVPDGFYPESPDSPMTEKNPGSDPLEGKGSKEAGDVGKAGEDLFPELWESDEEQGAEAEVKAVNVRVRTKRPEDPDPLPGEVKDSERGEDERIRKFRTLFLGIPLRTKKGKEVLLQVQCIINRLEAYGYPVHRYHSDRAKELRTAGLIAWLRNKQIHASWTLGDSPAGNRAELGVQNLKGMVRKLLGVAKLEVGYWPLALSHAAERNWVEFGESLGVPQVNLGVKIEARRRFKTGFEEQWQSRTVAGVYLGIAPLTPGGHLVLVEDGDSRKVLLTNTVYPLRGEDKGAVCRPTYRLTGKRSHFAVKVVAAAQSCFEYVEEQLARLSPGGESSSGVFQSPEGVFKFLLPGLLKLSPRLRMWSVMKKTIWRRMCSRKKGMGLFIWMGFWKMGGFSFVVKTWLRVKCFVRRRI